MPPNSNRLRSSGAATTSVMAQRLTGLGVFGTLTLHAAVVVAALFSFSRAIDTSAQDVPVVPVDLVTVADTNNVMAQSPEPPATVPEETPPVQEAAPPPVPEKVEVAPEPPKVVEKKPVPQAKPDKPKEEKFDIKNIITMLDKKAKVTAPPNAKPGDRTIKGVGLQTAMTMDIMTALKNQVGPCYNSNASAFSGAPRQEELIADFDVFLNPDGSVARSPQLVGIGNPSNPYAKVAEEAIRRAIYACAPYRLPTGRYDQWREINPWHFIPGQ